MKHQTHYKALADLILPYQDIWRNEIMLLYPQPLTPYPLEWIKELTQYISPEKSWSLHQGELWNEMKSPGLCEFYKTLEGLSQFSKLEANSTLPTTPMTWIHIIPKKQHEIEKLAPLVLEIMRDLNSKDILDIGGGQGHLAQTLAHHYALNVTSLDMDKNLQEIGHRCQNEKWSLSPHQVRFHQHQIQRNDKVFAELLSPQTLTTGLHTCGPLGVAHIEAAASAQASVINVPCCYHKLTLDDCNLSSVAKSHPIPWTKYALTLASSAYRKRTLKDVAFHHIVKRYRYTLHFILFHEFGLSGPLKLGNSPVSMYHGSFSSYAREQFRRLQLSLDWSDEKLLEFYQEKSHQNLITEMLAAGLIRDCFARALESILLIDRALWLEEQGHTVEIREIFTPQISPRNLAIVARA